MSKTIKIPAIQVTCAKDIPQQIKELKRELSMRKHFYRKQVNLGRMNKETANNQFQTLNSTLHVLQAIYAANMGTQAQLFAPSTPLNTPLSTPQNQ